MDKEFNNKSILESLLFVNEKPISTAELSEVLAEDKKTVELAMKELCKEYLERSCGICIVKVAGGYQMCSSPVNEPWIKKMYREKNKQKLSSASLETVAIIAYKQPITRMEVESIRGVNIDGVAKHLLKWGLIKTAGRKEVPGRPFFYITTRKFLEYFGINSLKDLPRLEDFISLAKSEEVMPQDADNDSYEHKDNLSSSRYELEDREERVVLNEKSIGNQAEEVEQ